MTAGLQDLAALLATPHGRDLLRENGIHTDPVSFAAELAAPADHNLAKVMGVPGRPLVHTHQQVYVDQRPSVLAKIAALCGLAANHGVHPAMLWIDTDRAASDKLACRFYWPFGGSRRSLKIAPPGEEHLETRFATVDPARTAEAYRRIGDYLRLADHGQEALARLDALRPAMVVETPVPLRDYGLGLTRLLLHDCLGMEPPQAIVSDLLAQGMLTGAVEEVLGVLPAFVAAWNRRVDGLRRQGIDPAVDRLPPDYLPLFWSDPGDGARLRLRLEISGADRFAVAAGSDGRVHRFHLGSRQPSLAALAETGRWSPDVTLPLLADRLFSGWVAGKSSALYALVLGAVTREVLGREPIPVLVPARLPAPPGPGQAHSLLHAHLTGMPLPT